MKKVIGYLRVSTEAQDAERQANLIQSYCDKNNFEIVRLLREKESGAKADRKVRAELLSLSSEDGDLVIFSETSRLSREEDILKLLNNVNDLLEAGLDVLFLDGEKSFKSGKVLTLFEIMQLAFEAQANSDERKKFIVRAKSGKISKIKQGCFIGHKVAYSYKVVPNPKRIKDSKEFGKSLYVVDEVNRQTVELIFDLIGNKGYTLRGTAKHLNNLGLFKDKAKWVLSSINHVISNPLYYGDYSFAGEIGIVPAIVTKELYDKTQLQLKSNHLFKNKGAVHYNVLKGLFKCSCGGNYSLTTRANHNTYYNCINKRIDYKDTDCQNFGIKADYFNSIVWEITKAFLNVSDFKLKTEEATKGLIIEIAFREKQATNLLPKLEAISKSIETVTNNLMDTEDKAIYLIVSNRLSILLTEQTELRESIENINKESIKLKTQLNDFSFNIDTELLQSVTDEQKNEIYKKYIDKIVFYSVTMYRGFIHIKYKNGFESTILTSTRKVKRAYLLPQSFSFNPITRLVIESFTHQNEQGIEQDILFNSLSIIKREATYKEMFERYNMEEFNMNNEISKEEIERDEKYNNKYSDKLKELDRAISAKMNL